MSILRVKDEHGNWVDIPAIKGEPGKDGKDGQPGEDYVLTEEDKQEIANVVVANLSTETWTFTLENGSTVTKTVVLR